TRATTRGTANSCLARSEMTRLSSSSPVAATTTSTEPRSASRSDVTSQASAVCHSTLPPSPRGPVSAGAARFTTPGSCSMISTWCPPSARSLAMNWPTLPPPAMATFTSVVLPRLQAFGQGVEGVGGGGERHHVALLADDAGVDDAGVAEPGDGRQPEPARLVETGQLLARPHRRQAPLDDADLPAGIGPVGLHLARHQAPHDLVGGPAHGGHRGDPQPLVDERPAGVVDPGHDVFYPEVLPGDTGRQDVRIVAVGDGGQRAGPVDARLQQVVPVEPEAHYGGPAEALRQTAKGALVLVDDGHAVAILLQRAGQFAADTATTHDDDVHGREW